MFGPDRYHPSAQGYRAAVDVVLPTAFAVLGLTVDEPAPATSGSVTAQPLGLAVPSLTEA